MSEYDKYYEITVFSVADIPGLIEDAHLNAGLGVAFLKHVERCAALWFVLDYSLGELAEQLLALRHELNGYRPGLGSRPGAIVVNKCDLAKGEVVVLYFP
jgi:GTP-binding protein